MDRRGFLARLAGVVTAAAVVDPEQLLWTPGKVRIFDLGAMRRILDTPTVTARMVSTFAICSMTCDADWFGDQVDREIWMGEQWSAQQRQARARLLETAPRDVADELRRRRARIREAIR